MILGLDISTSCIGIAIYDLGGNMYSIDHLEIKTDTEKDVDIRYLYKGLMFEEKMIDIFNKNTNIKYIYVESPLKMAKNQDTVIKLSQMNAVCCFIIKKVFDITPTLIGVDEARWYFLPELRLKNKHIVDNEELLEYVQKKSIKVPKKYNNNDKIHQFLLESGYVDLPPAKTTIFRKTISKKELDIKQLVLDRVMEKNPIIQEHIVYDKNGNPKKHYYDMADACVVAYSGYCKEILGQ
jgi:hypothetical protein